MVPYVCMYLCRDIVPSSRRAMSWHLPYGKKMLGRDL
jgi:hypothetical protein